MAIVAVLIEHSLAGPTEGEIAVNTMHQLSGTMGIILDVDMAYRTWMVVLGGEYCIPIA